MVKDAFYWDMMQQLCIIDSDVVKEHKKVKVTLVQELRLCTGRMAHRGSRGIALLFHDQQY